tara:strand:- start:515 stop:925 length:411 start_codon:yes stop_codon:yes gene_type:complete
MFTTSNWMGQKIESEKPSLAFGYGCAIPEATEAAWGARAICGGGYSGKAYMDLLPDRQGLCYRSKEALDRLTGLLNGGILRTAQAEYKRLHDSWEIQGSEPNEVVLYDDGTVKMVGNTNGSHGYFYVAAWLVPASE